MNSLIMKRGKIENILETQDPFLTAIYHLDHYPAGDGELGPLMPEHAPNDDGDFDPQYAWHWYHGSRVPGFPKHPHRGFETVTSVIQGFVDHTDGLGGQCRYGAGDTQWMSAGRGLNHAEMFPLLHTSQGNPLELFQIWLNLPAAAKMSDPDYVMLWKEEIPVIEEQDDQGARSSVTVIAGTYKGRSSPRTTAVSWASDPNHHVAILLISLEPGAGLDLPGISQTLGRSLYAFEGAGLLLGEALLDEKEFVFLDGSRDLKLVNQGEETLRLLLLDGEPIAEPVEIRGPFVMNSREEIAEAVRDYTETAFGGWPHETDDPTHGSRPDRFAIYGDGREEHPVQLFAAPSQDEA